MTCATFVPVVVSGVPSSANAVTGSRENAIATAISMAKIFLLMSFLLSFLIFLGLVWSNASLLKRAKRYTFWQSGSFGKNWAIYRDFDGNS